MIQKIIISGFGGQGVLSAGLMIAESAVLQGYKTTYFPSYGAEMRGGTANCSVIISDKPIASPIIYEADTLVALNKPALEKFADKVKKGGLILVNSSVVKEDFKVEGRNVLSIPVEEMALSNLGNPKIANVIMIGVFIKATVFLKMDELQKAIVDKFGKKGEKVINQNFKALEMGFNFF